MILTEYVIYRGKIVGINKLKPNSHIKIKVQCPICGEIREVSYKEIVKNGHHMCQKCALREKNYIPLEIGEKFNKWTIIDKGTDISRSLCMCECGTVREVNNYSLKNGTSKSCGCVISEINKKRRKYLQIGMTYGKLKIIAHSIISGYSICQCECGNTKEIENSNLLSGDAKTCGCSKKNNKFPVKKGENHPNWKGGISSERECAM